MRTQPTISVFSVQTNETIISIFSCSTFYSQLEGLRIRKKKCTSARSRWRTIHRRKENRRKNSLNYTISWVFIFIDHIFLCNFFCFLVFVLLTDGCGCASFRYLSHLLSDPIRAARKVSMTPMLRCNIAFIVVIYPTNSSSGSRRSRIIFTLHRFCRLLLLLQSQSQSQSPSIRIMYRIVQPMYTHIPTFIALPHYFVEYRSSSSSYSIEWERNCRWHTHTHTYTHFYAIATRCATKK